ncbi:MAG TPA: phosphoribosyltransferase family protein [Candidatus Saccharimonadales bacterium]|nr:phosphoribosyltransferase family protein [Candidatus Saccharimonadales bacterium]
MQNVKNTMIDKFLSLLAPHLCYECQKLGAILCSNCKYNIINEDFNTCIMCSAATSKENICFHCSHLFEHAWCVEERRDVLKRIVNDYKFNNVYAAHGTLADLLIGRTPELPPDCRVVPIPTIPTHIRRRGYDHMLTIARVFAKKKGLQLETSLMRRTNTVQTGQTRKKRLQQAEKAFSLKNSRLHGRYLLVDDIVTTGATLKTAATLLRQHGATEVWVAVVLRQPLDKS